MTWLLRGAGSGIVSMRGAEEMGRASEKVTRPKPDSGKVAARRLAYQECINPSCRATFDLGQVLSRCPKCANLLDVTYEWDRLPVPGSLSEFERRWANKRDPADFSGVWRFRELLPFAPPEQLVTIGEGQTLLFKSPGLAHYVGVHPSKFHLQHEGLNPSGSFKDNGMAAAFTHGRLVGAKLAACASTGNTSASLALFASATGLMRAVVFVGKGRIAFGKLSQALDAGARTVQILGDFDDAMKRVEEVCARTKLYLVNSLNPFRLEGQKTVMYRVLEGLGWQVPDWVVVPGGNLGNSSAFGKAFAELHQLGLIPRIPRLAVINSTGADTFYQLVEKQRLSWNQGQVDDGLIDGFYGELDRQGRRARTVASAIEINRPVNLKKALRALEVCDGVVRAVTDEEILEAKARIGGGGIGCEPASAASVAGARRLREEGLISPGDRVVAILTGHVLKDPRVVVDYHTLSESELVKQYGDYGLSGKALANRPVQVENDLQKILEAIGDLS